MACSVHTNAAGFRTLCADTVIAPGTVVYTMAELPIVTYNSRFNITKNDHEFFYTEGHPSSMTNHACDPNVAFNYADWTMVAVKTIQPNEELRFNYLTTEFTMAEPFVCHCGSAMCYGKVAGFANVAQHRQAELLPLCAPYIQEKVMGSNARTPLLRVILKGPDMRALCTNLPVPAGTPIVDLNQLPTIPENDRMAITKEIGTYFDTTGHPVTYTNHSCDPNLRLDFSTWQFVTLRDLAAGDELTFNYLTTEYEMSSPFDCQCGSPKCFGHVAGFGKLADDAKAALFPVAAPYIQKMLVA